VSLYSREAQAQYRAYQNFVQQYQPVLINPADPQYPMVQSQMYQLWNNYTNTVSQNLLPSLTQLDYLHESLRRERIIEKTANDGLGKVFDISGVIGPADYRAVIYALDNAEGVETIFAPKVTVVNGQRAEIKDVTRLRYNKTIEEAEDQDVDVGDAFSVVYDYAVTPKEWDEREYGTRLVVTPSVQTDERTIELDVQPEVSTLLDFRQFVSSRNNVYQLPQFFVQSVKTTVTINDGDTLVMGGLMTDRLIRTKDKIPIFGDLPLVGRFFRGESEVARKKNLLVFINAKLIDPSGQTRRALAAR
jgi:general secretion pathway protein D